MTPDPIERIEEQHSFASLGSLGVQVFRGALEEAGGDHELALRATIATMAAIIKSSGQPTAEDESA